MVCLMHHIVPESRMRVDLTDPYIIKKSLKRGLQEKVWFRLISKATG